MLGWRWGGGNREANGLLGPLAKCRPPGRAGPVGEVVSRGFDAGMGAC